MMGFYPNAGLPYYLITTPYFQKTTIHLENDSTCVIEAKNLSAQISYIKKAYLNGNEFNHAWINHQQISEGGTLVLEMSSKPSDWANDILPPVFN
jgi:putative alpha-1,2-mannosidase